MTTLNSHHNLAKGVMSVAVAGLGAVFAYQLFNAPRSVRPGINAPFSSNPSGSAHEFVQRFEVESREIYNRMQEVVDVLRIQPGQNIADLGAGTGLFIEALSRAVAAAPAMTAGAATVAGASSDGAVLALDPYPKFVTHMLARVASLAQSDAKLASRISVRQSEVDSMGADIAPESLDLVLCTDAYHHFEYPAPQVASVYRALRPGARFVVLDFERIPGVSSEWVLGHVRAGKEVVRAEVEAQGFVLQEELQGQLGLKENYLLVFVKPQRA